MCTRQSDSGDGMKDFENDAVRYVISKETQQVTWAQNLLAAVISILIIAFPLVVIPIHVDTMQRYEIWIKNSQGLGSWGYRERILEISRSQDSVFPIPMPSTA
jgi:hypothetical protein